MSVLFTRDSLDARRRLIASDPSGDLTRLTDSLAADLEPALANPLWIPSEKAKLTRHGGRCRVDGTLLEFDPWSPRVHRCASCGRTYDGDDDHRWWIMGYQLWLAERAVHAAALFALRSDPRHASFARGVIDGCVERYARWPNRDNVLGPTRPFFSTYLESIWLLQLCVAIDLLELSGGPTDGDARDRLIAPSAALIASYDEGMSNRQVWNDAALLAAYALLDDRRRFARVRRGPSALDAHLQTGLLADGTWYEGENYHLFAQRGLWYGVTIADAQRDPIDANARARFDESCATPFLTALPDFTFPSRRDSQYAVSLRQWRFAELAELGLRDRDDDRLVGALRRLYASDIPPRDTGRARSTAEAERNVAASALTRTDLGWRSLLFARAALPPIEADIAPPASVLLDAQGYAVMRRDAGRIYVALDYGQGGGGHGHPDRLGLALHDGASRWLDDPGTGSYTEPTLHWYRSTLAHGAPLIDGVSQPPVRGELLAWDERDDFGWMEARVGELAAGVSCERTLVVAEEYVIDVLAWRAERRITVDLPLHVDGTIDGATWIAAPLTGGATPSDGFAFVHGTERATGVGDAVRLDAQPRADTPLTLVAHAHDAEWWRAQAPAPPGLGTRRFHLVRSRGTEGSLHLVWAPRARVRSVRRDAACLVVELNDGRVHAHERTTRGWRVTVDEREIELHGRRPPRPLAAGFAEPELDDREPLAIGRRERRFELGARDWRYTEETWREAGSPRATITMHRERDTLVIVVDVAKRATSFALPVAENPLDNENPDTNSDGVQLHLARGEHEDVWIIVPDASEARRVRVSHRGTSQTLLLSAESARTDDGYAVTANLAIGPDALVPGVPFRLGVVINEKPPERERRRGQLVLGGARADERAYLLGDRLSIDRLLPMRLADD